jgi:hypothetical protein
MYSHHGPATPEIAAQKWSNFITFVALLARYSEAQNVPILASQVARVRVTLALKYSPTAHRGNNVVIHTPVAAQ